jgi:hypothetical protein
MIKREVLSAVVMFFRFWGHSAGAEHWIYYYEDVHTSYTCAD